VVDSIGGVLRLRTRIVILHLVHVIGMYGMENVDQNWGFVDCFSSGGEEPAATYVAQVAFRALLRKQDVFSTAKGLY
jgi:hypothetical protein